tara:strand:- start:785 stop:1585 length:801 start_codon:yes stop_codon:yes gene_type:complete
MPIFAPFSYLKNPIASTAAWDPSQFTNAQYWWRADLGVTTTGTGVSDWEDQINGFTMVQGTDSKRPTASTGSQLNNQAVIRTNGTSDYLYTTTSPAALTNSPSGDFTHLIVFDVNSVNTYGTIGGAQRVVAGGARYWLDTLNGNLRLFDNGLSAVGDTNATVKTTPIGGPRAFKFRYDSSAGSGYYALDTLTETLKGSTATSNKQWLTDVTMAFGALVNGIGGTVFGGRYSGMDMAEQVMIYGTPSAAEMTEWKTYVNNRYGTIIS